MNRRTKIIATLGPTSETPDVIRDMVDAGMDVARINLSHGSLEEGLEKYEMVRKVSAETGKPIGTLVDLPGPKIRAGDFGDVGVVFDADEEFRLVPGLEPSTKDVVNIGYAELLTTVEVGDKLSFGDGAVDFEIAGRNGDSLTGRVLHGGKVMGRPGIFIPSDRLRVTTPTDADLRFLDAFVEAGVDMVAVSFVRSAHDVRRVGTEVHPRGPLVVAKIETRAAVENLTGIIQASGAVMIARGDLGYECEIAELPHLQKHIIRECIAHGRPAITATQMLESMVTAPSPTRAEVSDVANAVFDGSSVVMLSGETAVGHDPAEAVRTMSQVAARADAEFDYQGWGRNLAALRMHEAGVADGDITDTLTMAAWRAANSIKATAIICISRTGFTVRAIARFRPEAKILGFTPDPRAVHQLSLSWGATPMLLDSTGSSYDDMVAEAVRHAASEGHVRSGDPVAVLAGSGGGSSKATDMLRIVRVP